MLLVSAMREIANGALRVSETPFSTCIHLPFHALRLTECFSCLEPFWSNKCKPFPGKLKQQNHHGSQIVSGCCLYCLSVVSMRLLGIGGGATSNWTCGGWNVFP